jgi:hypothetical protein
MALELVYELSRNWKVPAHPDDYDPTDEELVDLVMTVYEHTSLAFTELFKDSGARNESGDA